MPNHCGNKLIIRGTTEDRRHFLNTIRGEHEHLDLNKIIATDGYDNRCLSWGTKWNCYDSRLDEFDDRSEITFRTAWCSYNKNVQIKMTELFPTLSFELMFAERGMEFYGWYKSKWDDFTDQVVFSSFEGKLNPKKDCVSCNEECDIHTCTKHCYVQDEDEDGCNEHEFYLTGQQEKYQKLYEISG